MPANTPATGSTVKARAVPMPCDAKPAAKPCAAKSRTLSRFISGVTMIAPMMPVAMTKVAVSDGRPPNASDTAIATAAVTDFGAREMTAALGAPNAAAIATAETMATVAPTTSAAAIGNRLRRTIARLL